MPSPLRHRKGPDKPETISTPPARGGGTGRFTCNIWSNSRHFETVAHAKLGILPRFRRRNFIPSLIGWPNVHRRSRTERGHRPSWAIINSKSEHEEETNENLAIHGNAYRERWR